MFGKIEDIKIMREALKESIYREAKEAITSEVINRLKEKGYDAKIGEESEDKYKLNIETDAPEDVKKTILRKVKAEYMTGFLKLKSKIKGGGKP